MLDTSYLVRSFHTGTGTILRIARGHYLASTRVADSDNGIFAPVHTAPWLDFDTLADARLWLETVAYLAAPVSAEFIFNKTVGK